MLFLRKQFGEKGGGNQSDNATKFLSSKTLPFFQAGNFDVGRMGFLRGAEAPTPMPAPKSKWGRGGGTPGALGAAKFPPSSKTRGANASRKAAPNNFFFQSHCPKGWVGPRKGPGFNKVCPPVFPPGTFLLLVFEDCSGWRRKTATPPRPFDEAGTPLTVARIGFLRRPPHPRPYKKGTLRFYPSHPPDVHPPFFTGGKG